VETGSKLGTLVYQFWKSREIEGTVNTSASLGVDAERSDALSLSKGRSVKTLTVKRTPLGELFMVIVVDDAVEPEIKFTTGRIAGFDFGLKVFLTCSDGSSIESPQFFKQSLNTIKKASRQHSKKLKGSRGLPRKENEPALLQRVPDYADR
jgi:putative transposase